jgi:hypothetical protein
MPEKRFGDIDYQELVEKHPKIASIMPESVLRGIEKADEKTRKMLDKQWKSNIKYNVEKNIPKWGWLNDGYSGIGRQKAIIAIGSGSSLKKNEEYLKMISLVDGTKDFPQQDFILMASNHEIKPCIKKGIIPHFTLLVDASEDLTSQMKVGKRGKHTTLVAALTAHPKVIEAWPGPVRFVCQKNEMVAGYAEKLLGEKIDRQRCVTEGGNILNFSFVVGIGLFNASVWMCVGNDLSYPIAKEKESRRNGYYADGDYTTNIKSKRDEASHEFLWAGYRMAESTIWTPRNCTNIEFEQVFTAPQLFIYKVWLEANSTTLWEQGAQFHIYNCTEGGILGTLLKEDVNVPEKYDEKFDASNWFMMDEISNGRWRTRTLYHACEEFHDAKERLLGTWKPPDAQSVTNMGLRNIH